MKSGQQEKVCNSDFMLFLLRIMDVQQSNRAKHDIKPGCSDISYSTPWEQIAVQRANRRARAEQIKKKLMFQPIPT